MNHVSRHTLLLALIALGLLFVDFYAHLHPQSEPDQLPGIAAIKPNEAGKLTFTQGDQRLVLERQDGQWMLTAPFQYRADEQSVHGLLAGLKDGIPFDVRVDEGNLERYGLDSSNSIFVQVDSGGSLTAFYVGNNAAGGSTYVRFPSSQTVYRARIGGRSRYERIPPDWRDKQVHPFEPQDATSVIIERRGLGDLEFENSESGWSAKGSETLDISRLQMVLQALADLTAHELLSANHPVGHDEATVAIATSKGDVVLVFSRQGDEHFVRDTENPMVFRIGPQLLEQLMVPDWRDPMLLSLDSSQIIEVKLIEPDMVSVLKREGDTWHLVRPANVATNTNAIELSLRLLGHLQVSGFVDEKPQESWFSNATRIEIKLASGEITTIHLGQPTDEHIARKAHYIRIEAHPRRVGFITDAVVARIKQAWSR